MSVCTQSDGKLVMALGKAPPPQQPAAGGDAAAGAEGGLSTSELVEHNVLHMCLAGKEVAAVGWLPGQDMQLQVVSTAA